MRLVAWASRPCPHGFMGETPMLRKLVLAQILNRLIDEGVEASGGDVLFDLAVPHRGVELREPLPELRQILRRKLADGFLDVGDGCHGVRSYRDEKWAASAQSL